MSSLETDKLDTLGSRLEYILKSQNLNNTSLAQKIGVTNSHIGKIIKGINNPSKSLIDKICLELCINKEWLLNGSGEIYKPELSLEYQKALNKFNSLDTEFQHFVLSVLDNVLKLAEKLENKCKNK